MKNKKHIEKSNKTNSNTNEPSNFTGKRRTREISDIIINKYDIYSILDELNFNQYFQIPKKKTRENPCENQIKMESNKNDVLNKRIKTEKPNLAGVSDTGCGVAHMTKENFIKTEENLSKVEVDNNNIDDNSKSSNSNQSLLKLILSDSQLCQFSEIFQIFTKEIESPFTLDYFIKLKENLHNENKDKIINTLIFMVWSLKFMKIENNYPPVNKTKITIEHAMSFSLLSNYSFQSCSHCNTENHNNNQFIPFKSNKYISQMASNNSQQGNSNIMNSFSPSEFINHLNKKPESEGICANNIEYPMICLNIGPYPRISTNYINPLNIVPGISLINSPAYTMTNSNVNNNQILSELINTSISQQGKNKETSCNSNKISSDVISESVHDTINNLDLTLGNQAIPNQTDNTYSRNNQNLSFYTLCSHKKESEKDSAAKDFNFLTIKKEDSFIDITLADEKIKEENFDSVYSQVINIFSKPISDETFKLLKNYLHDDHVDKIENIIKKNPFSYLNRKQYILLCKRDKEGLYLKIDPTTKKYSITRSFYKSK
jgi:hypothetical protein